MHICLCYFHVISWMFYKKRETVTWFKGILLDYRSWWELCWIWPQVDADAFQTQITVRANVAFVFCEYFMHVILTFNFCRHLWKLLSVKHLLKVMLKGAQRLTKGIHLKWKCQQVFVKWCHYYSPENNTHFKKGKAISKRLHIFPTVCLVRCSLQGLYTIKICFKSCEVISLNQSKISASVTRIRPTVSNYKL